MNRLALWILLTIPSWTYAADEGVLPVGADGKPLNLDFETGTLKDWTTEGEAFEDQPIKGDTVAARRGDMKSQHQGQYWIGGFERKGDQPRGALISRSFQVTHPWASFLVGGGPHQSTCVEVVLKESNKVIAKASGMEQENMRRVVVDLKSYQGKEIFIQVIDQHTGHWGHVNFDDFRFHTEKPKVVNTAGPTVPDDYKHAGLSPEEAAKAMTVPEGFSVQAFAGEPDVNQPIAMCLDDRGRVWIAEAHSYPLRRADKDAKDRILIFEDTDGDGKFDKKTIFMEGLNLVSGLEVGFGGVWIGAAPYLMYVPMQNDKPAGKPQILLDGWAWQDTHETLNTFMWGPDGWLYGCHGVFTHSRVGKPSTPDRQRQPINAGIWRYHPTKHIFEVFAHGTSNPWGLDFDDYGQAFIEACVIPHNWHIIQGARYQRQAGAHFNPYTFDDIRTIAEHRHYVGPTPHGGNNRSDSAGGGHAHCGTMIYLGGSWPKSYRNQMFMGNVHGHRLNVDQLTQKGSGYVASRAPDFLLANDAWARFINFRYGPDGNVYLIDWYDKQACHHNDVNIWDRTNGRIYKISYKDSKPVFVDLTKKTDQELVEYQLHENDWFVRHSRRILQERGGNAFVHSYLAKVAADHPDVTRRLRALWALHVTKGLSEERIQKAFTDADPFMRAWAIQLALEDKTPTDSVLHKMEELARQDISPIVRLYLSSALQRLELSKRWKLAENLLTHTEDAKDHNLPLMYWYGIEPLAVEKPEQALKLVSQTKIPNLLSFMIRRIGMAGTKDALSIIVQSLRGVKDSSVQLTYLQGLLEALKGRRKVEMPNGWEEVYTQLTSSLNPQVKSLAVAVAVVFGDRRAFEVMREVLTSKTAKLVEKQNALDALIAARDPKLVPVLQQTLNDANLRSTAIRGLALYEDDKTPVLLIDLYKTFSSQEKREVLNTMTSRSRFASALLDAIAANKIERSDLAADLVRQMRNLNDAELEKRITTVWGVVRDTPAEKAKLLSEWRAKLSKPTKAGVDLSLGRAVFAKTCQQCHTLYGSGGKVGPDITGSNRANLEYLLENIFDPSAVIPNDYAATILDLEDGRSITGIVKGETPAALTVVTATETLTIPKADVQSRKLSQKSMMPDDVLKPLNETEIRALFAYLQHPTQVAILTTEDNVKDFFNGKDLTGWDGNSELWKVENGEIVGKTNGLKKNEFLKSQYQVADFRLTLKVKLTPNKENSGIQFRSEVINGGDVKGYQADIGAGWWGKLYEEHGRELLVKEGVESVVKVDDWNEYEIIAVGSKIRTFINGKKSVDIDDPKGAKKGIIAFQLHSGGPMEVRFKDLKLEVNPKWKD